MSSVTRLIHARKSLALYALLTGFLVSANAFAQSSEQYIITARAGGVNLISGKVLVQRKGETSWHALTSNKTRATAINKERPATIGVEPADAINSGDSVRTEETGRFEVLLNPGAYLRLAENSEMELIDASLDSLRLKINKGTAILEATGKSDIPMTTEIVTPQTRISVVKTGLYRINVLPDKSTEVIVRKGRAVVGTDSLVTLKSGKKATFTGGQVNLAGVNKKNEDAFDFWSRQRAEALMAANGNLPDAAISNAILNTGYRPLRTRTGLWIYDPFLGFNTFFPFYSGWQSPYGYNYAGGFGYSSDYYLPYYNTPRNNGNYSGGGGGTSTSNPPSVPTTPNNAGNERGRGVRGRKELEGDGLPIRPIQSNAAGQRVERTERYGGGGTPQYRQPNENNGSRSSEGSYRQNSQPAPVAAPARQEPVYRSEPSPQRQMPMERSGPRGKNLEQ